MNEMERQITECVVSCAVRAGLRVSANYCETDDYAIQGSSSVQDVMDAIGTGEQDVTLQFRDSEGNRRGWVVLLFGNRADVISDYSINAYAVIGPALELAEKFAD